MAVRQPYVDKYIKDLSASDTFVSVSGVAVSKADGSFVLDDGSGEIVVLLEAESLPEYVRVFGRVLPYEDGLRLQADFFQDISKIDKLLYKKVKDLLNR
ncbi:MAG: hypothetical protein ABIH63_00850 [archaeon]